MEQLAVVDAHIHLWDLDKLTYPWLNDHPKINRSFLLNDYDKASSGHTVEKMVFVQAECSPSQFLDEVNWVSSIADADSRLAAIVPWAPLHTGNAASEVLEKYVDNKWIKGVRRLIQPEQDPNFCLQPDFVQGVRLLGEKNLHFEITIDPIHFPAVTKLMELCPGTRFVLDHIGNPNIATNQIEPWKTYLKAFAESGPHYCKFSNLVCNANLEEWSIEDLKPYAQAIIENFGPERMIWASDWPHALRASSWSRWFETAMVLTKEFNEQQRMAFFRTNAMEFYKL